MISRMGLMIKNICLAGVLAFSIATGSAQSVSTPIVGFVTTTLAAGSDTIIAPQVLRPSELVASVSGVSTSATQATLTLEGAALTANQFQFNATTQPKTYFALVTAGNLTGTYFLVASNTTSELTVNLDGLTVSGTADVSAVEVRPCWTLATLFPAADANVSFTPSASAGGAARRTQILFPNNNSSGVNRAPVATYFFNNATGVQDWVLTSATGTKAGTTVILPGGYVIHRNTGGTPVNLAFTHTGSVLARSLTSYVGTTVSIANDSYLSLPRASDYTLAQLGFTDASFTQSLNKGGSGRRDQLLVIPQAGSGVNRAPTATYFKFANDWYSVANTTAATNNAIIPAGAAIIIRKVAADGNDRVWVNTNNVSL